MICSPLPRWCLDANFTTKQEFYGLHFLCFSKISPGRTQVTEQDFRQTARSPVPPPWVLCPHHTLWGHTDLFLYLFLEKNSQKTNHDETLVGLFHGHWSPQLFLEKEKGEMLNRLFLKAGEPHVLGQLSRLTSACLEAPKVQGQGQCLCPGSWATLLHSWLAVSCTSCTGGMCQRQNMSLVVGYFPRDGELRLSCL